MEPALSSLESNKQNTPSFLHESGSASTCACAQVKALPLSRLCGRPARALLLDLILQLIEKLLIQFKLLLNQLILPPQRVKQFLN